MSIATSDIKFMVRYAENDTDVTSDRLSEFIEYEPGTVTWSKDRLQIENFARQNIGEGLDTLTTYGAINLDDEEELHNSETASIDRRIDEMLYLAAIARPGKRRAFVAALQSMDWAARPATDFVQALQLSLSIGAFMDARQLALQAVEHYPQHSELQKYARLLGLPEVTRNDLPPDPTLKTNQAWLNANRTAYHGQWVALRDGQLIDSANSLQTLVDQVGHSEEILFTRVV